MDATSIVSPDISVALTDSGLPESQPPAPTKDATPKQVAKAKERAGGQSTVEHPKRQEKPCPALPGALKKLKGLVREQGDSPWRLGDAMADIERMNADLTLYPHIAKLLPKGTTKLNRRGIIGIIRSWSPNDDAREWKKKEKEHYRYIDVATEFPVECFGTAVRCEGLKFTPHSDVLRAIRKLEKKGWLVNWGAGRGQMERRRDFLQQVAEAKKAARDYGMKFNRLAVEKLVSESEFCCKEHRGEPLTTPKTTKPAPEEKASQAPTPDRNDDGGLPVWQVDGADEDRICYVASITENDALVLLGAHGVDLAQVTLKPFGRLNVTAGVFAIERKHDIEQKKAAAPEQKAVANA